MNRLVFADRVEWHGGQQAATWWSAFVCGVMTVVFAVLSFTLDPAPPVGLMALATGVWAALTATFALVAYIRSRRSVVLSEAGLAVVRGNTRTYCGWDEIASVRVRFQVGQNSRNGVAFVDAAAVGGRTSSVCLVPVEEGMFRALMLDLNAPLATRGTPLEVVGPQVLRDELASLRASAAAPVAPTVPPRPSAPAPAPAAPPPTASPGFAVPPPTGPLS
ncbi:hypothetical protein [Yinghuangia soli]|uniref:PH domain-containing protein n=1 Tax=Yinghuangia soli TaxID=2908204 RepID=A0AA41Q1F9_9ACTN|nr:hypothetical protein [Yinghuangia soli]MCF2529758.1 hypothetical protein [Yinghuangia soli]